MAGTTGGNGNGYVTWKSFVALALPIIAVPIIVTWALLLFHSSQPHAGAVRHEELRQVSEQIGALRADIREFRQLLMRNDRAKRLTEGTGR